MRITHRPSGIVVQCQNERSQSANRATAMAMLRAKLIERQERERQEEIAKERGETLDVNFGSQIRSYVLHPYTMVKDHRTDFEVGNANGVLDGDLDGFVRAWLGVEREVAQLGESAGRGYRRERQLRPDRGVVHSFRRSPAGRVVWRSARDRFGATGLTRQPRSGRVERPAISSHVLVTATDIVLVVTTTTETDLIDRALAEDVGDGDVTTEATVDAEARGSSARSRRRNPGVISGLDVAEEVFRRLDPEATIDAAHAGGRVARGRPGAARHRLGPRAAHAPSGPR